MRRREFQRGVTYIACTLPRWLRTFLFLLLFRATNPIRKCWRFGSFEIYDITLQTRNTDVFFEFTKKALILIQKLDSRRYQRIEKQIRRIINIHLLAFAEYRAIDKSCNVDFRRYAECNDPELGLRAYACTLVHEATHGVLESRCIPYTRRTKPLIECICIKESLRFARKFEDKTFDWEQHFLAEMEAAHKPSRTEGLSGWQRLRIVFPEIVKRKRH